VPKTNTGGCLLEELEGDDSAEPRKETNQICVAGRRSNIHIILYSHKLHR